MEELERTFLAKSIPRKFLKSKSLEIHDIYFPARQKHPKIRLRRIGEKIELTKKEPINKDDASVQLEQTIILTEKEYKEFKKIKGKELVKTRYYCRINGINIEMDVYKKKLKGLIMIDVEFKTKKEKRMFKPLDFFGVDITQDKIGAAGILAGKSYKNIEKALKKYNYNKILI